MNVVLVTWHDLGCHLGCYGRTDVSSPHLDRFARESVLLNNFFATNPICSPSRASLLSGQYPNTHGLQGLVHDGWRLKPGVPLVEEIFREAGYRTAIIGHQHERSPSLACVCDDLWVESTKAAYVAPEACRRLREYQKADQKFFMRIGFSEVHRPIAAESDEGWEQVTPLPFLKDTEEHRRQLAKYNNAITKADHYFGQILDTLKETGLWDETLVVFVTDHGIPFPGAKLTLSDAGLKIAGILHVPGIEGKVLPQLLSGVDLVPTILDICGLSQTGKAFDGKSFRGAMQDDRPCVNEFIYAERAMPMLMRAVRSEHYKYILNFDRQSPQRLMGAEELKSSIGEALPDHLARKNDTEEFYDLVTDPHETTNLARLPDFEQKKQLYRNLLLAWMRKTRDPILTRQVLPPHFESAYQTLGLS